MSKKALSPIIATILLLLMTVAAAGTSYFWIMSTQAKIQSAAGAQVGALTKSTISVVGVSCANKVGNSTANITVLNTGGYAIVAGTTVVQILNSSTGAILFTGTASTSQLATNTIVTLSFNSSAGNMTPPLSIDTTSGIQYGFDVIMPGAIENTGTCITP